MTTAATSPYVMYRLDGEVASHLGLDPDTTFPVRNDMVDEIFGEGGVRFDLIVDELDRHTATHPDTVDSYGPVIAPLTHLLGIREGADGRPEVAARYFARGLSYAPDSFRLNADLGLAYQLQGRTIEAAAQYRRALALQPDNPLVLLLAARANQELGYDDVALAMLDACPPGYRNDPTFEDLYQSLRDEEPPTPDTVVETRPTLDAEQNATPVPRSEVRSFCTQCGTALDADCRFCPACGDAVTPKLVPEEQATPWQPTHSAPADGATAWERPHPSATVIATIPAWTPLQIIERREDWAHVRANNGWEAWVDVRKLTTPPSATPPSPPRPTATPPTTPTAHSPVPPVPPPTDRDPASAITGPMAGLRFVGRDALMDRKVELGAAAAMLVSIFVSWAGGGGSTFDIPASFLLTASVDSGGPSLGLVLTSLTIATMATVALANLDRYRQVAGGVATGLAALFLVQLLRALIDLSSPVDGVRLLLTDTFGPGPWLLLAAGVVLVVRR